MSERTRKLLTTAIIIVGLVLAVWFGLKWFGNLANDNVGDYDGGRSVGEEIVDNYANG